MARFAGLETKPLNFNDMHFTVQKAVHNFSPSPRQPAFAGLKVVRTPGLGFIVK
jgi:hypothetical protein